MKHLCIKIKEKNQDVAYCVNQQREGVRGMFDNTLAESKNLESVDIDAHIKALIDDRNNGEEEIMRLIDEKKINESGFANQDDALWLTIGTYDDLVKEVEQEIEYQKEHRENEEKAVKKYLSEIGKRGGKKGGSSRTPKKSASSAANLDAARADGKTGGYPKGRPRRAKNLNELYEMMKSNHPATLDVHGQWSSSLPTFGGSEPSDTREVWSWDETRLIVGTCEDDLKIISREEWEL